MSIVNFYNYMWMYEDLRQSSGALFSRDYATFIQMCEAGGLTNFVQVMGPVMTSRARINHIHEFYSQLSDKVSETMDGFDYDVIQKDAAMAEQVKFNAKTLDQISDQYNDTINQLVSYYDDSSKNLIDNFTIYQKNTAKLATDIPEIINAVIEQYRIDNLEAIKDVPQSLQDATKDLSSQYSAQTNWFRDELDKFIQDESLAEAEHYYFCTALSVLMSHLLQLQMTTKSSSALDSCKDHVKPIFKGILTKVKALVIAEKSGYAAIDSTALDGVIQSLEQNKQKANDTYLIISGYPQKSQAKNEDEDGGEDKQEDLDSLIKKGEK